VGIDLGLTAGEFFRRGGGVRPKNPVRVVCPSTGSSPGSLSPSPGAFHRLGFGPGW